MAVEVKTARASSATALARKGASLSTPQTSAWDRADAVVFRVQPCAACLLHVNGELYHARLACLPPPLQFVRLNTRAIAIEPSGETVPGELGVIVAIEQPEAKKLPLCLCFHASGSGGQKRKSAIVDSC
jgi:hypothetical protein